MSSLKMKAEIVGIKELMQTLDKFTGAVQRKILRPALNAEGTKVLKQAKSNVPVLTGLFKKALGRRTKTYKDGGVVVIVGPRHGYKTMIGGVSRNPVYYAHLVEGGAAPHFLRGAASEYEVEYTTRFGNKRKRKRKVYTKSQHPGFAGKHPLKRAYESALNGAAERMASRMAQEIEKLAAKGKLKVS